MATENWRTFYNTDMVTIEVDTESGAKVRISRRGEGAPQLLVEFERKGLRVSAPEGIMVPSSRAGAPAVMVEDAILVRREER